MSSPINLWERMASRSASWVRAASVYGEGSLDAGDVRTPSSSFEPWLNIGRLRMASRAILRATLRDWVQSGTARRTTHPAPRAGATSPARNRQLHRVCPTGRRDNEQAGIGIARPEPQGRRHLPAATQARFAAFRFPWTPSKSAHSRTYDWYTNHGREITKTRTGGYSKPETCFWWFDTFWRNSRQSGIGLIRPQFKANYPESPLEREIPPLDAPKERKA